MVLIFYIYSTYDQYSEFWLCLFSALLTTQKIYNVYIHT